MINEVAAVILVGIPGWKSALLYVRAGGIPGPDQVRARVRE
jgi:hypothetical protein